MAMHVPRRAVLAVLAATLTILTFGPAMADSGPSLPGRAAFYSVWYQEHDYTRVIMPPALPDEAASADEDASNASVSPCNAHIPIDSVCVEGR